MSIATTAAATKMRDLLATADDMKLISTLEILSEVGELGAAERCASDFMVDELTIRFEAVNDALSVWEHDLESTETMAEVAVRVAREFLGSLG